MDFTGSQGNIILITATRNATINGIFGQFRSFEFTDLGGLPGGIDDVTILGYSGTDPGKWAGGAITEFGSDFFAFEVDRNSSRVTFGDTITVAILVTPEPSTALLLGGGLMGLAAHGRRRKV